MLNLIDGKCSKNFTTLLQETSAKLSQFQSSPLGGSRTSDCPSMPLTACVKWFQEAKLWRPRVWHSWIWKSKMRNKFIKLGARPLEGRGFFCDQRCIMGDFWCAGANRILFDVIFKAVNLLFWCIFSETCISPRRNYHFWGFWEFPN